jgi:hypothetical protein
VSETVAGTTVWVEIGFASDPGTAIGSTTWTDVTAYVREVAIRRGRQRDLGRMEAGTCVVRLSNSDGRFDPADTSGAYYPNVRPMRRLRVRANDASAVTHTVFSGFIEDWPQEWPGQTDAVATVTAVDGFAILARRELPASVYAHEVASDSPIHWYRLGETSGTVAIDQGSKRLNGVYEGGVTLGTTGLVEHDADAAVEFTVAQQVVVDSGQAGVSGTPLTVEAIVVPDAIAGMIVAQGRDAVPASSGFALYYAAEHLRFQEDWDGTSQRSTQAIGQDMALDGTYHVAAVTDGSTATIYINGSDDSAGTQPVAPGVYRGLRIAGDTLQDGFDGTVDEVAIYATALSSSRISAHASARTAPWNGDTSDERIARILDLADWPSADRALGSGVTTFGDADIGGFSALDYIRLCADSESGVFFVSGDGKATLVGRHELITTAAYATSQVTLSDAPGAGEFGYTDLALDSFDVAHVYNEVRVQRKYSVEQVAVDAASQTAYLRRVLAEAGLLMDNDPEALSRAQWILGRSKDPKVRVERVTMFPTADTGLFEHALGLDLLSRVTVEREAQPSGFAWSQESLIQGIEHRITPAAWHTAWWLSPADANDYLVLDDATLGRLNSNALAY